MRIWRAVQGEGSELGNHSRARGTPLDRGEGTSSAFSPDPECSPKCYYCRTAAKEGLDDPPKLHGLG
jgi:hypothetical protein